MLRHHAIILVLIATSTMSDVGAQEGTPILLGETPGLSFPSELYCEDIVPPLQGPMWQDVQIGAGGQYLTVGASIAQYRAERVGECVWRTFA